MNSRSLVNIAALPVATDEERSAFFCSCGFQCSYEDESEILSCNSFRCPQCRMNVNPEDVVLGIKESFLKAFENEAFGSLFHVSDRPDWAETLHGRSVHLGSLEATKYRANDRNNLENVREFYLFEVKLKSSAVISAVVHEDAETDWEPVESASKGVAVVYLNRYEDPGSLSLLCSSEDFEVVASSEKLTERMIWDSHSWNVS